LTTFPAGQHTFTAQFSPSSSAFLSSTSAVNTISLPKINTGINLTSSTSPSFPGQTVTFTANLVVPLGTPTGNIQFNDGAQTLANVNFSGAGQVRVSVVLTSTGTHDITATYGGDNNFIGSSAHFAQVVGKLSPSLTLTAPATADYGQSVKLTANLIASAPGGVTAAGGTIQFFDGATAIGAFGVVSNAASMTISSLSPGPHQLSASYSGDANWNGAKSPAVTTTVGRGASTVVLSYGATSTQTTFVAAIGPATGPVVPAGTVQFTDVTTGKSLGNAVVNGGKASVTLTVADLAGLAGHSVIAVYAGDANFTESTSNSVAVAILANTAGGPAINFAAEEFATVYGAGLAAGTGDTTVAVIDSIGGIRPADIVYASPTQVNFLIPSTAVTGPATVTLKRGDTVVYTVQVNIALVAPGVFTSDGSKAAAQAIRVTAGGSQSVEDVSGGIDIGSDTVYLVLYCTGVRGRSELRNVTVLLAGQTVPALYAGPQGGFDGLDQVNVQVPAGLKGAGVVNLSVTVDGFVSNTATLTFK
jgi:uncharacterized protein (TIGR03437 family)